MSSHHDRIARFRESRWLAQGGRCHYCDREIALEEATAEHIVPKAFGGTDGLYNIVAVCQPCNNERGHGLQVCACQRCQNALAVFQGARRGHRQIMQHVVYVGDRNDVAAVLQRVQNRRDRLMRRLNQDGGMDEATRLSCTVAAKAYDQVIGMLIKPVEETPNGTEPRKRGVDQLLPAPGYAEL